jgi:hypothetical protein
MYCRSGNAASEAEIGYIEPITTGAPLSFEAVDPDVMADDGELPPPLLELLELLEHAAAASATQAKPATRRSHFVGMISPYACWKLID